MVLVISCAYCAMSSNPLELCTNVTNLFRRFNGSKLGFKLDLVPRSEGATEEAAPKTGLFSLPFMVRAAKRQKQAAAGEAAAMLREIEAEELEVASDNEVADQMADGLTEELTGSGGRFMFGNGAAPAAPSEDEDNDIGR